jgi:superfamily I DNA/RNA helicase
MSRTLEAALRHAHIPYSVRGSTGFYDRAVDCDALGYLRAINNPADNLAGADQPRRRAAWANSRWRCSRPTQPRTASRWRMRRAARSPAAAAAKAAPKARSCLRFGALASVRQGNYAADSPLADAGVAAVASFISA